MSAGPTDGIAPVLHALFDGTCTLAADGGVITTAGMFEGGWVAIVGTSGRAAIGTRLALDLARAVLDVMRDHPERPILLIVDNSGHRIGQWDELMGNNGCIAHLTRCLDLARRRGHKVIGLVHDMTVSGGFMATGLATGACYALPGAEVRVMAPEAMARITKLPLDRLQRLSETLPVLGPGAANFVRVGGLDGIWTGDFKAHLRAALAQPDADDPRRRLGVERGGRLQALRIAGLVRAGLDG